MKKPFSSPGDLPNPGIKPRSPALKADSLLSEPGKGSPYLGASLPLFLSGDPQEMVCLARSLSLSSCRVPFHPGPGRAVQSPGESLERHRFLMDPLQAWLC